MKRKLMIISLMIGCLTVSMQSANAQEEEVRAAMEQTLAAWGAGDFETLGSYYDAHLRGFMLDGGFLITGFSVEALQAAKDAGFAFNVEPRDEDIRIVSDGVSIAVATLEGSITFPGGEPQEGSWRYSETRVKQDGTWKVVQYHFSPLTLAPLGGI